MSGTVYIDAHGTRVGFSDGRLTLRRPGGEQEEIPVVQIDQVIVLGHAHFTHDAIAVLLRQQVAVVFSSLRGGYQGMLTTHPGRQITRRQAQYDAMRDAPRCISMARALVLAKLRGHARLLHQWGVPALPEIEVGIAACCHVHDLDRLRGYEGAAAKAFFGGFRQHLGDCPFTFDKRSQHPPPDPVNALLSLTYTLLMNEVEVGVEAAGLDAAGGFFHAPANGRPTLLMDLVEPLRPLADRLCAKLLRHELAPEDFETAGGACHLRDGRRGKVYKAWESLLRADVSWRGERTSWRRLIHLQARELGNWLDGSLSIPRFWHLDDAH